MQSYRDRKRRSCEAWGDPFPPACICGCGEPVGFDQYGPKDYVNQRHMYWLREFSGYYGLLGRGEEGVVEVTRLGAACKKIMKDKGWTSRELAERGGMGHGHLNQWLYPGRGKEYVERGVAEGFLKRVAGIPTPPTPWQVRQEKARMQRLKKWERQNGKKGPR